MKKEKTIQLNLSFIKMFHGITQKTKWCIISETQCGKKENYLGLLITGTDLVLHLTRGEFVTAGSWRDLDFSREIFPATKRTEPDKLVFEATSNQTTDCEDVSVEVAKTFIQDMYQKRYLTDELKNHKRLL